MSCTSRNILDSIEQNLRLTGLQVPVPGELLRRVNIAQDRISQELGIPYRYIKGVATNATFELPTEARPGGLMYAEEEDRNLSVPLMTVMEANDRFGWRNWDDYTPADGKDFTTGRVLIYDPANLSAPVTPLGFDSGETLRLLYRVKPTDLTDCGAASANVEPFMGQAPEYGERLLTQYVTFEMLMLQGDQRANVFWSDYRSLAEEAFNYMRPEYWVSRMRAVPNG